MNSLYQQFQNQSLSSTNNIGQIKRLMNTMRGLQNPQAMIAQNPQLKQAMDLVRQGGGDPKTVFYKLAEQKGVDPNAILNALK